MLSPNISTTEQQRTTETGKEMYIKCNIIGMSEVKRKSA